MSYPIQEINTVDHETAVKIGLRAIQLYEVNPARGADFCAMAAAGDCGHDPPPAPDAAEAADSTRSDEAHGKPN
jgi:hypothetical protein